MKHLRIILVLAFYLTVSLKGEEQSTEYFKPANIRKFADYLFEEDQYMKAAGEYGRYLFREDSFPQNADSIFFRIALCYRLDKNYKHSIKYFRKIADKYPESPLLEDSYLEIGKCYSLMDSFELSNKILKACLPKELNEKNRTGELMSLNYMQTKEWDKAREFLNSSNSSKKQLFSLLEKGENLPKKNKLASGLFSAVIPGSGKFYCNRPADGFHSFATVSLTCWQAYEGFEENGIHSVKGWIFGVFGGLLYLGNIYGSVVAADIYNEEQEIMFKLSVKKYLNENFK
jgi:tetratricopeptide (TPR) repeat protein